MIIHNHVEQVGGDHYQAPYQHWDYAAETGLGYLEGNASKYLARHRKKHEAEDLEKAQSYIQKLITLGSDGLVPAAHRPRFAPTKLSRFLRAAKLDGSAEAALIVALDSWRTVEDLQAIDADLGALIRATRG